MTTEDCAAVKPAPAARKLWVLIPIVALIGIVMFGIYAYPKLTEQPAFFDLSHDAMVKADAETRFETLSMAATQIYQRSRAAREAWKNEDPSQAWFILDGGDYRVSQTGMYQVPLSTLLATLELWGWRPFLNDTDRLKELAASHNDADLPEIFEIVDGHIE